MATRAKSLEFITLDTGSTVMSSRSEVDDEVVRRIKQALRKDGALWAGWSVELFDSPSGLHVFRMRAGGAAVSRCCVCVDPAVSDAAWADLAEHAPDQVVLHRPRGAPWLAVQLLPGYVVLALASPEQAIDLADAERCVAWALLESDG